MPMGEITPPFINSRAKRLRSLAASELIAHDFTMGFFRQYFTITRDILDEVNAAFSRRSFADDVHCHTPN